MHIFRKSAEPAKANEIAYQILGCRRHHAIFDDGTWEEIESIPNIHWALEIMESADPQYYYRFKEFKKTK